MPSQARKHATSVSTKNTCKGAEQGKSCNRCQAWKNSHNPIHNWFGFIVELLVKQFFYLFVRPRDLFFIQASQLEKLLPVVLPQFYQGLFSKDKKGSEEAKQRWLDAVKQATTVSRLHLLLEMLDSTVIWDLSAENAVC